MESSNFIDENWRNELVSLLDSINFSINEPDNPNINWNLFALAFLHPSLKSEHKELGDYHRLEFLGDALLDLIVAHEFYSLEELDAGQMTEFRKRYVSNSALAKIFDCLELEKLIIVNRSTDIKIFNIKSRANFVESFFGAMFVTLGYDRTKQIWKVIIDKCSLGESEINIQTDDTISDTFYLGEIKFLENNNEININPQKTRGFYQNILKLSPKNAKSLILEIYQKAEKKLKVKLTPPEFKLINREGPPHDSIFTIKLECMMLFMDNDNHLWIKKEIGIAKGHSKKEGEFKAAYSVLKKYNLDYLIIN
ncbi:MAG: ribonuclease III domain-containing protein [Promethearchaeota archaeon]